MLHVAYDAAIAASNIPLETPSSNRPPTRIRLAARETFAPALDIVVISKLPAMKTHSSEICACPPDERTNPITSKEQE